MPRVAVEDVSYDVLERIYCCSNASSTVLDVECSSTGWQWLQHLHLAVVGSMPVDRHQ